MTGRRIATLLLALATAITAVGTPLGPTSASAVRAATPDLTVVTAARYDVQPAQRRVRVTVDLTMHNRLKDTKTKRYFFDHAVLDVIPQATGFRVTSKGSGSPTVRVTRSTADYTRLRINFGGSLFSGKTATYRLTFFLKDPGGAATRDLRVGDSLVSFPVWAFGTESTPGSSVTVVFPSGYVVDVEAGEIPAPDTLDDGRLVFRTGPLAKPLEFFAYLVGSRPGAFDERVISADVDGRTVEVTVRSWSDDEPWAKRVAQLLSHSLPLLGERIGLGWPESATPLTVQEAISRSAGGYAGRFDPAAGLVEIAYYADDFVVFHEAAHAWFNGSLLADRWANEAFASYYATRVAADLKHPIEADKLTDQMLAARIPLNGWGPVGSEDPAQEAYAYAASLTLARAIAKRAGDKGLRAVWSDAANGVGAYQPLGGETETGEEPPDWRGLLDLLEARTDATYDDLWRDWIARPSDLVLLDARAVARERYEEVVVLARDWRLPVPIRDAMRAWRFEEATAMLDGAQAVLEERAALTAAAEEAGLVAPDSLRLAFEDADGFDDATAQATAERAVIDRYVVATGLRPTQDNPIVALGLWGTTPETDLAVARRAFARGDLEIAVAATEDAAAVWTAAESIGQTRAISIALLVLAVLLGLAILVGAVRRRRRRHVRMQATRIRG